MPRSTRKQHTTQRKPYQNYAHASFNWLDLFRVLDEEGGIRKLARQHHIPESTLRTRYHNWIASGRPSTNDNTPHTGLGDARGLSTRALSAETEKVLADLVNVRRNKTPMHDADISQMARTIHAQHEAQTLVDISKPIATRADGPLRPFKASRQWTYSFKRRHDITNTHHPH